MITKTLYIEYRVSGILTPAYAVTLSSHDGSFGLKRKDTGEIIAHNGTAVQNPSTGRYEYPIDLEENTPYQISWALIPANGANPKYFIEDVGPFVAQSGAVRAVADHRGTFIQTTIGTLFLRLSQGDPSQISLQITDSNGSPVRDINGIVLTNVIPEKISDGFYFFDWAVAQDTPPGDYSVVWAYIVNGAAGNNFQTITIAQATEVNPQSLYVGILAGFRLALSNMLSIAQYVVVQNEQCFKKDSTLATCYFNFPRWNQTERTQIYLNNMPVNSGITINYFRGCVTFDQPLTPYDTVTADYTFRWYSDEELDTFLSNAIGRYNTTPPFTNHGWNNMPPNWYGVILDLAASYAIRNLMMRLLTMETKLVFGGPEAAKSMFGDLETLKKNYEEEAKEALANKKLGPYAGLTRMLITETYSLPGGRSRWFRSLFSGGS